MRSLVRPELPTASVGSSQAPTAAVDNSAPSATRPQSTYKSGKAVQTNGATSRPPCSRASKGSGSPTRPSLRAKKSGKPSKPKPQQNSPSDEPSESGGIGFDELLKRMLATPQAKKAIKKRQTMK